MRTLGPRDMPCSYEFRAILPTGIVRSSRLLVGFVSIYGVDESLKAATKIEYADAYGLHGMHVGGVAGSLQLTRSLTHVRSEAEADQE